MKKLYLILLMLLLLFIPIQVNAVAIYQLDQPVKELNNYTLRQVFQYGNINLIDNTWSSDGTSNLSIDINGNLVQTSSSQNFYMFSFNHELVNGNYYVYSVFNTNNDFNEISIDFGGTNIRAIILNGLSDKDYFMSFKGLFGSGNGAIIWGNDFPNATTNIVINSKMGYINLDNYGISSLMLEQLDMYYDLYLEAVRYEQENKEAVKDEGNYKHIFMSIYEGLTNLMKSMGSVWAFLSTPIINSNITEMGQLFNIDWSWNIFDIFRQLITDLALFVLQLNTYIVSSLFFALGIPIKISILSLVFSDFVFVVLTWIIFKSFII